MTDKFEEAKKRRAELIELERPAREDRARKLRILRDIITERFNALVEFEQLYSSELDEVSSFAVFHYDKEVRSAVKLFVKDAIPRIGLKLKWTGGDIFDIKIREQRASAHEKMEMLERLDE
jgi:hypothetical protein